MLATCTCRLKFSNLGLFQLTIVYTVNREYFVVKIFSDSLACVKIKRMNNINDNAVQGHLSKNYLMRKFIA